MGGIIMFVSFQSNRILYFLLSILIFSLSLSFFVNAADVSEIEFSKALLAFDDGDYEAAAVHLEKGLEGDPENVAMLIKLGQTYNLLKEFDDALDVLDRALKLSPNNPNAIFERSVSLLNTGDYDEAFAGLESVRKAMAKDGRVPYYQGLIRFRQDKFEEAIDFFKEAEKIDKSVKAASDYYIGVALYRLQRYSEARPYFKSVEKEIPKSKKGESAKKFISAIDAKVRAAKPWTIFADLSWQYDDNVTLKPSESVPGVRISGRGDWKGVFYLGGTYRFINTDNFQATGRYSFYQSVHRQLRGYNITGNQLGVNFSYRIAKPLRFNVMYSFNYYELDETRYLEAHSLLPSITWIQSDRAMLQAFFRYQDKDYLQDERDVPYERDAVNYNWGLSQYIFFMKNNAYLRLYYSQDKDNARGSDWDYNGIDVGSAIHIPLPFEMSFDGDFGYTRRIYEHINSISIINKRRRDKEYDWSIEFTKKLNDYLSLSFKFNRIVDDSTVALYNYDREITSFNLKARF
ncbi:MAG: hypothetical protein D6734_00620 [Candidatus Schekmanbacteria bacterium]|nr:MAG: hypothetical protein D6734_00620 [Candidatus Schekmanbacteria bacterium]